MLRVSDQSLRKYRKDGKLPEPLRVGRKLLFDPGAVRDRLRTTYPTIARPKPEGLLRRLGRPDGAPPARAHPGQKPLTVSRPLRVMRYMKVA